MLQITKQGNSIVVEGLNHYFYPHNGTMEVPCNSVITMVDEGDIVLFRSASNYDVLFSAKIDEITIDGQSVTKDNVGEVFGALSNVSSGGLTPEQEEKLNSAVQISDYNADKATQTTIDEAQTAEINKLKGDIAGKQDIIQDLNAIREGANLGKTALQEETDPVWTAEKVNYYTKTEVNTSLETKANKSEIPTVPTNVSAFTNDAGYLTEHQSLNDYYTKTESDSKYATQVVVNEEIAARINDVREVKATLESKADKTEIPTVPTNVSAFTNDAGYLTEHQQLKTINGETIVGNGNIEISSGEETDPVWTAEKVNYYTKTEVNTSLEAKADKTEIPNLNGYATEQWVGQQGYLTEHQSLKTINGETIVGNGNITISGGEQISDILILPQDVEFTYKDGNKYKVVIRDISYNSEGGLDYTISIWKNGVESTNTRKFGYMVKTISSWTSENYNSSAYGYKISNYNIPDYVYIFSDDDNAIDENKMYFDIDIPLKSGTNIKTINGESILGSGDLVISGGGEETDPIWTAEKVNYYTKSEVNSSLEAKANKSEIPNLNGYATEQWVGEQGYLTEHQSLDNYYTKSEVNSSLETKANKSEIPNLNGYATEQWVGEQGYLTQHQSLDNYYTKSEIDGIVGNVNNALSEIING